MTTFLAKAFVLFSKQVQNHTPSKDVGMSLRRSHIEYKDSKAITHERPLREMFCLVAQTHDAIEKVSKRLGFADAQIYAAGEELCAADEAILHLSQNKALEDFLRKQFPKAPKNRTIGIVYHLVSDQIAARTTEQSLAEKCPKMSRAKLAAFMAFIRRARDESKTPIQQGNAGSGAPGSIDSSNGLASTRQNPDGQADHATTRIINKPILEAANTFLTHNSDAAIFLKELYKLNPGAGVDSIVKSVLEVDDPLHRLWAVVMTQINKSRPSLRLTPEQGDCIRRFCDYATCLVLPHDQLLIFREQMRNELVRVNTNDQRVILLHFVAEWAVAAFDKPHDQRRIVEKTDNQVIPSHSSKIASHFQVPGEIGAGGKRGGRNNHASSKPDFVKAFIRGLALELAIPGFQEGTDAAIGELKTAINEKLNSWLDLPGFPIRLVIFGDEARTNDNKELKSDFPQLFFVQLPSNNHRAYVTIGNRRGDIDEKLNPGL